MAETIEVYTVELEMFEWSKFCAFTRITQTSHVLKFNFISYKSTCNSCFSRMTLLFVCFSRMTLLCYFPWTATLPSAECAFTDPRSSPWSQQEICQSRYGNRWGWPSTKMDKEKLLELLPRGTRSYREICCWAWTNQGIEARHSTRIYCPSVEEAILLIE